jgi:hypothetical protein
MNRTEKAFLDCIRAEAAFIAISEAESKDRPIRKMEWMQSYARYEDAAQELANVPAVTIEDLRMKTLAFASMFGIRGGPSVAAKARVIVERLAPVPDEDNERVLLQSILVDCITLAFSDELSSKAGGAR